MGGVLANKIPSEALSSFHVKDQIKLTLGTRAENMCTYWHVRSSESGDGGGQAILRRLQNRHASEGLPVVAGGLLIAAATAREEAVTPEAINETGGETGDSEERGTVLDCLKPPET